MVVGTEAWKIAHKIPTALELTGVREVVRPITQVSIIVVGEPGNDLERRATMHDGS